MSSEQMDGIREEQMKTKKTPGIYGNYALWRNKTIEEYIQQFQIDQNFVIRLRSPGNPTRRVVFEDLNRGKVSMPENNNDVVLLKSTDGLPTYHLAMLVDDHLMQISHVIRGEEWLTSVPLHIQLYEVFGFTPPQRCHLPLILKLDDGKKRKLSKRFDPEASIEYLFEQGYAPDGIVSFALSLINSNFEDRIKANPQSHYSDFEMRLDKIGSSGVLFDMDKFNFVNNVYLSKISNEQLFYETLVWATTYHPSFADLMR
jgi:glutamyl-tRNA synthetase